LAALARGFSDRHFERGEGPGDEVAITSLQPFRSDSRTAGSQETTLGAKSFPHVLSWSSRRPLSSRVLERARKASGTKKLKTTEELEFPASYLRILIGQSMKVDQ